LLNSIRLLVFACRRAFADNPLTVPHRVEVPLYAFGKAGVPGEHKLTVIALFPEKGSRGFT